MNATHFPLASPPGCATLARLAPLALCLALSACGGSSGSDRGHLGSIDPIPLPLNENYAPVAARLAVTYPGVVAEAYLGFFELVETITTECDDEYVKETFSGDGTFELHVDQCTVATSTSAPISTHSRTSDLLLTYKEQPSNTYRIDIAQFKDDVRDVDGWFEILEMTRADGSFTLAMNGLDGLRLTDSNARLTRSVVVTDRNNVKVPDLSSLMHLRLQDYDLTWGTIAGITSSEHNGRLTTYVGSIEAYVDIDTDNSLEQGENEDCPSVGQVTVTGRDDETMTISFSGTDVTVMMGTTSLDYPVDCAQFLDWIETTEL